MVPPQHRSPVSRIFLLLVTLCATIAHQTAAYDDVYVKGCDGSAGNTSALIGTGVRMPSSTCVDAHRVPSLPPHAAISFTCPSIGNRSRTCVRVIYAPSEVLCKEHWAQYDASGRNSSTAVASVAMVCDSCQLLPTSEGTSEYVFTYCGEAGNTITISRRCDSQCHTCETRYSAFLNAPAPGGNASCIPWVPDSRIWGTMLSEAYDCDALRVTVINETAARAPTNGNFSCTANEVVGSTAAFQVAEYETPVGSCYPVIGYSSTFTIGTRQQVNWSMATCLDDKPTSTSASSGNDGHDGGDHDDGDTTIMALVAAAVVLGIGFGVVVYCRHYQRQNAERRQAYLQMHQVHPDRAEELAAMNQGLTSAGPMMAERMEDEDDAEEDDSLVVGGGGPTTRSRGSSGADASRRRGYSGGGPKSGDPKQYTAVRDGPSTDDEFHGLYDV
jgi:hypothetical protein